MKCYLKKVKERASTVVYGRRAGVRLRIGDQHRREAIVDVDDSVLVCVRWAGDDRSGAAFIFVILQGLDSEKNENHQTQAKDHERNNDDTQIAKGLFDHVIY